MESDKPALIYNHQVATLHVITQYIAQLRITVNNLELM